MTAEAILLSLNLAPSLMQISLLRRLDIELGGYIYLFNLLTAVTSFNL